MSDRDTVRSVDWREVIPALHLFSALRIALNFRNLLLAALAIIFTLAGWQTCTKLFSNTTDPTFKSVLDLQAERVGVWPWERPIIRPQVDELREVQGWQTQTPMLLAWRDLSTPFVRMFKAEASFPECVYWLTCALWSLAVWAFFGGAITRTAAVSFARQENLSWQQLSVFVRSRWLSYVGAALFPIFGAFLIAAFLAVLGLAMRADWGVLVGGIVWPLVLFAGFMMAFLLVGLFAGWPLMWAAISSEGTDSFGALSHSYSYSYQRPAQYFLYVVIAALVGVLGWYLVSVFSNLIIALSLWGVSWGTGQERLLEISNRSDLGQIGNSGLALIYFWNGVIATLNLAFVFSFFWSAATVIYVLLRRAVDNTEFDEVHLPDEHRLHTLPPLKTDGDGVVEPADDAALAAGSEAERKA
jgi:hypothetical protein